MGTTNKSPIITFKEDVFYYHDENGIYFRNNKGYFRINISNSQEVVKLIDLISEGYTLDELKKNLDSSIMDWMEKVINILENRNFLTLSTVAQKMNISNIYCKSLSNIYNLDETTLNLINKTRVGIIDDAESSRLNITNSLKEVGITNISKVKENIPSSNESVYIFSSNEISITDKIEKYIQNNLLPLFVINSSTSYKILYFISSKEDYNKIKNNKGLSSFQRIRESQSSLTTDSNSQISAVLALELFKLITGVKKIALKNNIYLFDAHKGEGSYYPIVFESPGDDCDFFKYIDSLTNEVSGCFTSINRAEENQLPLANWTATVPVQKALYTKVMGFGDSHEEARLNSYLAALEKRVTDDLGLAQAHNVVCTLDDEETVPYAVLKSTLLRHLLDESAKEYKDLQYSHCSADDFLSYYIKLINIMDENVSLSYINDINNVYIVKVKGGAYQVESAGFSLTEATVNSLRLYLFVVQRGSKKFDNSKINRSFFKYMKMQAEDSGLYSLKDKLKLVALETSFSFSNLNIKALHKKI